MKDVKSKIAVFLCAVSMVFAVGTGASADHTTTTNYEQVLREYIEEIEAATAKAKAHLPTTTTSTSTTTTVAPTTTTTAPPTTTSTTEPPTTTTTTTVPAAGGTTYWADGSREPISVPSGGEISAYATGAKPSSTYVLATGCVDDIRQASGNVISDAEGNIPTTTGAVTEGGQPRPDGTYNVCFLWMGGSGYTDPTAPVQVTVGGTATTTTTTTTAPTTTSTTAPTSTTTTTVPPATGATCDIAPNLTAAALEDAIEACPDGTATEPTLVQFPVDGNYSLEERIDALRRENLILDGRGTTLNVTYPESTSMQGTITFFKARNVHVKNFTVIGNFNPDPTVYPKRQVMSHYCEAQPGIAFYGGLNISAVDLTIRRPCGDGVGAYMSRPYSDNYLTTETNEMPTDVLIQRVSVYTPARMCWGPTQGNRVKVLDNYCEDAWYGGIDMETDTRDDLMLEIEIARNRFNGFNLYGILVPVGDDNGQVGDFDIYDNVFDTGTDNPCIAAIQMGIEQYGDTLRFHDVHVWGNQIKAFAQAVAFWRVDSGAVTNNTVTRIPGPEDPYNGGTYSPMGYCGFDERMFHMYDSPNVLVASNTVN